MYSIQSCVSLNTETFWRFVSKVSAEGSPIAPEKSARQLKFDDQVILNYALLTMEPVWSTDEKCMRATTDVGFTVTLVSEEMICRRNCTMKLQSQYYVWHKPCKKNKTSKTARSDRANLWILRKDWTTRNSSNATGKQWLREISVL